MYNIGDEFVITKENECCWEIGTVVKIMDIDEYREIYKYNIEPINDVLNDFWLCSDEEIKNVDVFWNDEYNDVQEWNIDSFAVLIENEECNECMEYANEECNNKYNFTTYGEMQIVGSCYEDVVSILMSNGYIVQVEKNDVDDFNEAEFTIVYGKKEN